jgi:hypothetical protein
MQEDKKPKKAKENNSFRRKERSVFKNSLTGPTLLEMSGLGVNQDLKAISRRSSGFLPR